MSTRQHAIEEEIGTIKQALVNLGPMHPGSLSQQKRAGSGTYYQLSYTHAGKGHTAYVRREHVRDVTQQVQAYRRFRELIDRWVALEIERGKLTRRTARKSSRSSEG